MHLFSDQKLLVIVAVLFCRVGCLTIPVNKENLPAPRPVLDKQPILYHRAAAINTESPLHISSSKDSVHKTNGGSSTPNGDNVQTPKDYAFSYAIRDRKSGDDYSHSEAHDGGGTKGEYKVKLPDGRIQVVTYTADTNGYRANIRYDLSSEKGSDSVDSKSPATYDDIINQVPKFIKSPLLENLNSIPVNPEEDRAANKRILVPFYSKEIRTAYAPKSPLGSYETMENSNEQTPIPGTEKLVSDVNYLLRHVKPTIQNSLLKTFPAESNTFKSVAAPANFQPTETSYFNFSKNFQSTETPRFDHHGQNPKYIHIHKYHPTNGETITSNLVNSREILDQNYQIPARTNFSDSLFRPVFPPEPSRVNPHHSEIAHYNIAVRNRSFEGLKLNAAESDKVYETFTDAAPEPYPAYKYESDSRYTGPHSTEGPASYELNDSGDSSLIPLSEYDARKLSGYFDFAPEDSGENDDHLTNDPYRTQSLGGEQYNEHHPQGPNFSHEAFTTTPLDDNTETYKNTLPHYYYEFSTASPSYRYVDPSQNSQAPPAPPSTTLTFSDGFSFNSSHNVNPFLRPLTRERVYIHHNSQPTPNDVSNTIKPFNPSFAGKPDSAEVSIVKSISSTIPPELISEFDLQLPSSENSSPGDKFQDFRRERSSPLVNGSSHFGQTQFPTKADQFVSQQVNNSLVQKIQSTLSSQGKIYLKSPITREVPKKLNPEKQ